MEYKQIKNILTDLNKTTKLEKLTHKRFIKNLEINYDNFNNLLNGMLQIFTLKDICLVLETQNINLDKKRILIKSNHNSNYNNYQDSNTKTNLDIITELFNSYNTPQFLNSYIDKKDAKDQSYTTNKTNKSSSIYFNEKINSINTIENWYILDITNICMNDNYNRKQYIPIKNYEYKYITIEFIDYSTGLEWELRIMPTNDNDNDNLHAQKLKIMIITNYNLSSKRNIIETQINNLVLILKNIDGVLSYL
jgi:hypothetical protein